MKERILFLLIVGMILTGCGQGEKERVPGQKILPPIGTCPETSESNGILVSQLTSCPTEPPKKFQYECVDRNNNRRNCSREEYLKNQNRWVDEAYRYECVDRYNKRRNCSRQEYLNQQNGWVNRGDSPKRVPRRDQRDALRERVLCKYVETTGGGTLRGDVIENMHALVNDLEPTAHASIIGIDVTSIYLDHQWACLSERRGQRFECSKLKSRSTVHEEFDEVTRRGSISSKDRQAIERLKDLYSEYYRDSGC